MKKLVALSLFCLLGKTVLHGQEEPSKLTIEKGTWSASASGSLSLFNAEIDYSVTDDSREQNVLQFQLSPKMGYAIKENLIVGVGLSYNQNKSKNEFVRLASDDYKTENIEKQVSIAPFVRFYKGVGKNLGLFLQGELGYGRGWSYYLEDDLDKDNTTQNTYFARIAPGITYFVTNKLALESSLGIIEYTTYNREDKNNADATIDSSSFNIALNPSLLSIGLAYYF